MKEICHFCGDEKVTGHVPVDYLYWRFVPICWNCYNERRAGGELDPRVLVQE